MPPKIDPDLTRFNATPPASIPSDPSPKPSADVASSSSPKPTTTTTTTSKSPPSPPPVPVAPTTTPEEEEKEETEEATFPQQLMEVIENETRNGAVTASGERVLEWLPNNTATAGNGNNNDDQFIIRDKKIFEKKVLPRYFNAKCKFMSFIRKLYRWGFRQVEKSIPGIMIFNHVNFVRGDKQRCLKMRSIVKKQTQHHQPVVHQLYANHLAAASSAAQGLGMGGIGPGGLLNAARLQGLTGGGGGGHQFGLSGMMGPNRAMGGGVAAMNAFSRLDPQGGQRGPTMYPQFQGRGGGGNNNEGGLVHSVNPGTASALFSSVQSQFNPRGSVGVGGVLNPDVVFDASRVPAGASSSSSGINAMGMTSAEMFEAGLRLERMENRQQHAMQQMSMMDAFGRNIGGGGNLHATVNAGVVGGKSPSQSSSFHPPQTTSSSSGGNFGMSEVELASEIMKRPGMDPLRALELAKRFNSST